MVNIVSDSSTLYSVSEANKIGLTVVPLSVHINNKSYIEFEEISSKEFVDIINEGHLPTSSQPSIGEKELAYRKLEGDILDLSLADGLSGTYQSALMASKMVEGKRIEVINTKTLCGPHRYIINKALALAMQNKSIDEIINEIIPSIENGSSFLIPSDFSYLKRGGRLSPLAATLGGLMKIVPILEISEDGKQINKFGIKKTYKKAILEIANTMKERKVDDTYFISISHASNIEGAMYAKEILETSLNTEVQIYDLSPVFITHGGPGCVAIQYCKK